MKKEIEVKARVHDKQALLQAFTNLGVTLNEPLTQRDTVYLHKENTDMKSAFGRRILRIREQGRKTILTLKIHQSNELDSIEEEIIVDDAETAKAIIEHLDFVPVTEITKTRQTGHYQDYELCLDSVEGLGDFVEVEIFTDGDATVVQHELFDFLMTLGITKDDQETRGYDTLMRLKREGQL